MQVIAARAHSNGPREAVWRVVEDASGWSRWGAWKSVELEREGGPAPGASELGADCAGGTLRAASETRRPVVLRDYDGVLTKRMAAWTRAACSAVGSGASSRTPPSASRGRPSASLSAMQPGNVERLRAALRLTTTRAPKPSSRCSIPRWSGSRTGATWDGSACRGRDGVRKSFEELYEGFDKLGFEVDEFIEKDNRIVALGEMSARGRTTGVEARNTARRRVHGR